MVVLIRWNIEPKYFVMCGNATTTASELHVRPCSQTLNTEPSAQVNDQQRGLAEIGLGLTSHAQALRPFCAVFDPDCWQRNGTSVANPTRLTP